MKSLPISDLSLPLRVVAALTSALLTRRALAIHTLFATAAKRLRPVAALLFACGIVFLQPAFATGGGPASFTGAQSILNLPSSLDYPSGVAVDASGNLYVADQYNSRVLKLTPSPAGYIQSTVGTGLVDPTGVTLDASGNVYIADNHFTSIFKETLSGGAYTQSTIGSGMFSPTGVAVDSAGTVYVAEYNGLLKETPSGGSYTQTAISLSNVMVTSGIAVDANLNVYFTGLDTSYVNHVWKLVPSMGGGYTQTTLASPGGALGIAVDASGDLYIANDNYGNVLKFTPSGNFYNQTTLPMEGSFYPAGVAVDADGDLFYTSLGNNEGDIYQLVEFSPSGGTFGAVNVASPSPTVVSMFFTINSTLTLGSPVVLTQGAAGLDFTLASGGTCTASTAESAGDTCTVDVEVTPSLSGNRQGAALLYDNSGNLDATGYVNAIGIGPQVAFLPGSHGIVASGLSMPGGIAVNALGDAYISNTGGFSVLKETLSVGSYSQSALPTTFLAPAGLALDGAGNLYVSDYSGNTVYEETPSGTSWIQSTVANAGSNGLSGPSGVAVDESGDVYIADTLNNRVLKETLSAGIYAQSVVASSGLSSPSGVAVDGIGNVYITDTGNNRVLKETPSAGSWTQSVIASIGLSDPTGIAVDGNSDVFIVDSGNTRILKETLSAGSYTQSIVPTTGLEQPSGVAVDALGNVYVGDQGTNTVIKEDFSDVPGLAFASTTEYIPSGDSPRTVTLQNIGNAALTLPTPNTGNNPSISASFTLNSNGGSACPLVTSSSSPGSLAAEALCLLPISFTPQTTGFISGQLVLTDNALNAAGPGYATQTISLSGNATAPVLAALTSPTPNVGTVLGTTNVQFQWTAGTGVTQYQLWLGTTGPSSSNIYDSSWTNATSAIVPSIPADGVKVYARLFSRVNNAWQFADFTYIETGTPVQAVLTTPTPGLSTILGASNVQFQWTAGSGVTEYQLWLGTTAPGASDVYNSGWTTNTSVVVPTIPSNGVTLYARLNSRISGVWQSNDYVYTESGTSAQAVLISPTPGLSTILGVSNVQFQWTAGSGVTEYQLWLGTTAPGSSNLYNSNWTTSTTVTVPTLPANGVKVYARLYSRIDAVWQSFDYVYTEPTPMQAVLTTPTPGAGTILGSSNVQFQWTTGSGISNYQLWLGTTGPGSSDLYNSGYLTSTSVVVPTIPSNGVTVYARLNSRINGNWQSYDYVYTESGSPVQSVLTTPTPGLGTVLGTSNVQFQWTAGSGVTNYQLWIGTTGPGASDLYNSGWLTTTSTVVPTLPSNGATVYVRLLSRISGNWQSYDYVYTETGAPAKAVLTTPTPGLGTVLGTSNIPFQWTAGTGVTNYQLWIGTTGPGASDLYNSGWLTTTSTVVPTVPSNGATVYVRLLSRISGNWQSNDYVYTETGTTAQAVLTTPTPGLGTVLGASNVQFQWTTGTGVTLYQLWVGTTGPGSSNVYNSSWIATTSTVVPTLPTNGGTVYVRLLSRIDGSWQSTDYVYTAAP